MHIDIRTSVAHIHVSPPTIKTITACLMSLAPTNENGNESKQSTDVTLWSEKAIDKENRWYLAPGEAYVYNCGNVLISKGLI